MVFQLSLLSGIGGYRLISWHPGGRFTADHVSVSIRVCSR